MYNLTSVLCPHCKTPCKYPTVSGDCTATRQDIFSADAEEKLEIARRGALECKGCHQMFHVDVEVRCEVVSGPPYISGTTADRIVAFIRNHRGDIEVLHPLTARKHIDGPALLNPFCWNMTGAQWCESHLGREEERREGETETWENNTVNIRAHVPWLTGDPMHSPQLKHLGPEPLEASFNAEYLLNKCRGRKIAIKQLIMNGSVVVGVGNIYANEALYTCGLRPNRPAGEIAPGQITSLIDAIKLILSEAIAKGGTTLRNFVGGNGRPGYFKQELQVYGRAGLPCRRCGNSLNEIRLGQRSTVYCPNCQK